MTEAPSPASGFGRLPGNPMMWILIGSEMLVFGAALVGFAGARLLNREMFHAAHLTLDRVTGTVNTGVLLTSGLFAALAAAAAHRGETGRTRMHLLAASLLGLVFLAIKVAEYWEKAEAGIGIDTNTFFTLYFLITGFHLAHVIFGVLILAVVARWPSSENVETGVAFWHMVDLVWVLIFPVIYLAG